MWQELRSMVRLQILENRQMRWHHEKEDFGTRGERHKVGRFIIENSCCLPVTVLIQRLSRTRSFAFTPILVNGHAKNVAFQYRKFLILMSYEDVAEWIKLFISSKRLYENETHHYYV